MSGRVPHIIQPNKGSAGPQAWIVFDVQALPRQIAERRWQHDFRLATAVYWSKERERRPEREEWRRFSSGDDLIQWIASAVHSKERVGVIAHHADYAAQVLDIHCKLPAEGWRLVRAVIDKGRWAQRWRAGLDKDHDSGRSLTWLDLGNWYPLSLAEIGQRVGIPRWTIPPYDAGDNEWFAHSERDSLIAFAALRQWLDFRDANDLGYFAPTIAGQAFNAYRHRFMAHPIYVHTHADCIELEQEAYHGGRAEARWRGKTHEAHYAYLDVNSMFASVMLGSLFPTKQRWHTKRMGIANLRDAVKECLLVARVTLDTALPAFPLRTATKTLYPTGTFKTTLATPELALALEMDVVIDVSEVIAYDGATIFTDYIRHFWEMRLAAKQAGDRYTTWLCKQFLTALYGKFGQRLHLSELLGTEVKGVDRLWQEFDYQDRQWYTYRLLSGRLERETRQVLARDSFLAIPAHVTSYARVKLWRLMVKAGLEHTYYLDTDSLIVDRVGLTSLWPEIQPEELGGLRLIQQTRSVTIRGPKWYSFGTRQRRSGLKASATEIEPDEFIQDEFRSANWALRHEFPCAAIVDEVRKSAPHKGKIHKVKVGDWVAIPHLVM